MRLLVLLHLLIMCFSVSAGVTIEGTRIVFPSNANSVSVRLMNDFNDPALVQNWIDDGDPNAIPSADKIPFIVTPPLTRVEPNKSQIIRIIPIGQPVMPTDRESLFWFNMLDIPPNQADAADKNILTFLVRSRIKLFYRPAGLPISQRAAFEKIAVDYSSQNGQLTFHNPTPYFMTVNGLVLTTNGNDVKYNEVFMMNPFDQHSLNNIKIDVPPTQATYFLINDFGGLQSFSVDVRTKN